MVLIMTKRPDGPDAEYITPGEASRLAFVTPRTLTRLAKRGSVRAKELPSGHRRYLRSDVEALLTPTSASEQRSEARTA
jgi:DNA-binding transcriptional MerR regulator